MPNPPSDPAPLRGILLMISAVTVFTVMQSLIKAADRVPAGEAVFFRSVVTVPLLIAWFAAQGRLRQSLGTRNWKGHATRGLVGTAAMGLGFAGLKFLPFPEVTALRFMTPILVLILAALMLGETVRLIRLSAVVAGLAGVVIILAPRVTAEGNAQELFGASLVLGSALCAAFAQIFVKRMTGTETAPAIVFYFALTATTASLLTVPFGWVVPRGVEWVYLIGAGTLGVLGQLCLTASYARADASVLAPFTYVSMIWAIVIGWTVFAEIPTVPMLAGSALIVTAGIAIFLRERQLGLRRAAEAKVRSKGMQ